MLENGLFPVFDVVRAYLFKNLLGNPVDFVEGSVDGSMDLLLALGTLPFGDAFLRRCLKVF